MDSSRFPIWVATLLVGLVYLAIGFALRYPLNESKVDVGGDEHHYLTQAVSLLEDGDLVVKDNYERGDYTEFYSNPLEPGLWNLIGEGGYSGHSPGAGVLVAPGWRVAGWSGVLTTLAATMALSFALTALTLNRMLGSPLPTSGIILLAAGFTALPLLAFSHTLYPETFMAPVVAGVMMLTVVHSQADEATTRTSAAIAAISLAGFSVGLHPRYAAVLVGTTAYFFWVDWRDSIKEKQGFPGRVVLYLGVGGGWLLLVSWLHGLMWEVFNPLGWWWGVRSLRQVGVVTALVHFLDIFFGRELGLFVLTPLALVAVPFLFWTLKRHTGRSQVRVALMLVILMISIAGVASLSDDWRAGDAPLGRYAAPLVPALLLVSVWTATKISRSALQAGFLITFAGLGLAQSIGYAALPMSFRPQPERAGGLLDVLADRVDVIGTIEPWVWSAAETSTRWVSLLGWTIVVVATIRVFAPQQAPPLT